MLDAFTDDRQPLGSFLSRQILAGLVNVANAALGIHVTRNRTAGVGDARVQCAGVQVDSAGGSVRSRQDIPGRAASRIRE